MVRLLTSPPKHASLSNMYCKWHLPFKLFVCHCVFDFSSVTPELSKIFQRSESAVPGTDLNHTRAELIRHPILHNFPLSTRRIVSSTRTSQSKFILNWSCVMICQDVFLTWEAKKSSSNKKSSRENLKNDVWGTEVQNWGLLEKKLILVVLWVCFWWKQCEI